MWMDSFRIFTTDATVRSEPFSQALRKGIKETVASFLHASSWLMLLLAFGLAVPTPGQEFRAGISGIVTDATGASVVGARVEVTDVQRKVKSSTLTNDVGRYAIEFLLPSTYQLTIEAKGFKKYVQENFSLWH
jgi:hypothetical protein